jgi:hypothetical protein
VSGLIGGTREAKQRQHAMIKHETWSAMICTLIWRARGPSYTGLITGYGAAAVPVRCTANRDMSADSMDAVGHVDALQ